jgi:SAM-dependent methyltransferase
VDLGHQPPSNAYLTKEQLDQPEITYPLRAFVCEQCWLVQLPEHARADQLFTNEYAYFSSVSSTWVAHARRYVGEMVPRFGLSANSLVVEIASNDGYLLQFVKQAGIPCVGIEPTSSTAVAAREKGIETIEEFFGEAFARGFVEARQRADLLLGNNVLAHVPNLNDFVAGAAAILTPDGVVTFEFPHLMRLVEGLQFDTIYHEHYSYLSFTTVCRLFEQHGLRMFDVQELPTHGGSLRVFGTPETGTMHQPTEAVAELQQREQLNGMQHADWYDGFQPRVNQVKNDLLQFLLEQNRKGQLVVGYGAAAKGNTLLNYAGVRSDMIPFVCDAAPSKQGKYLPGSHIPICHPETLQDVPVQTLLIFPWNIAAEVIDQNRQRVAPSCCFAIAVPSFQVLN